MLDFAYERKRIILSTNSSPTYSFYSPITSLLWIVRIHYFPIIFACGEMDKKAKYALDFARDLGAEIHYISNIKGYTDQNISQFSRLFASVLPITENSYLLTGDIDMWPFSKYYFHQQNMNKKIHLFGANTSNHKIYPMCYIGMEASTWRQVMDIDANSSVEDNMEKQLDAFLGKNPSSYEGWFFDENLFVAKIKKWSGYPNNCQMIDRSSSYNILDNRIDRDRWIYNGYDSSIIDSHVLRPGFYDDNWPRLLTMLKDLLPKDKVNLLIEYKNNWEKI